MGKKLSAIFDEEGVLFVPSALGVKIKILRAGWELISRIKHPELKGKLKEVVLALRQPDVVLVSDQSERVFLYHRRVDTRYIRVVCRHYDHDGEGFLITAHYIKRPKGGGEIHAD